MRVLPQFISRMWLRLPRTRASPPPPMARASCRPRSATWRVTIVEETAYPFDDSIDFIVSPERAVEFTLVLRKPGWAGDMEVTAPGAEPSCADGWWRIRKTWQAGDRVRVTFAWRVRTEPYANGEVAVLRGPLQYALPLAHRLDVIRSYPVPGFHDYDVHPVDIAQGYRIPVLDAQAPDLGLTFEARAGGDRSLPWDEARLLLRHRRSDACPPGLHPAAQGGVSDPLTQATPASGNEISGKCGPGLEIKHISTRGYPYLSFKRWATSSISLPAPGTRLPWPMRIMVSSLRLFDPFAGGVGSAERIFPSP